VKTPPTGPPESGVKATPTGPPEPGVKTPPTGPPTEPPPVTPPRVDGKAQLDQLLRKARAQLRASDLNGALATVANGRRLGLDAASLNQVEREVQREIAASEVRRAIDASDLNAASTSLAKLESIDSAWPTSAELRQLVGTLRTTLQRRSIERRAMVAFFAGDYQQTLTLLGDFEKSAALSSRGYFYRACSLAALALRANPPDPAQMSEAKRQYARVAAAGLRDLTRDRQYISPEILKVLAGS
jgi:hypothetical protein